MTFPAFTMVRGGGLEPPHHCWRQDLNLVRLPISPPARFYKQTGGKLSCRLCEIGQPSILPDADALPVKQPQEPLAQAA